MSAHIPEIIKKNRSLAELTTFEIGGAASFFAEPAEPEQLTEIITWANREKRQQHLGSRYRLQRADLKARQ